MARIIRRHWRIALLQLLIIIVGAGFLLHRILKSPAPVQASTATDSPAAGPLPTAPKVDLRTYLRVKQLREQLALRNEDLAAMSCTQSQATQVLSTLTSWTTANSDAWTQQEQAVAAAKVNLADAMRQVNVGPADPVTLAQLPSLQQANTSAKQRQDQFFQPANEAVSGLLASGQQQTWATIKSNASFGAPSQYRYATGISADQAKQVTLALYRNQNPDTGVSFGIQQTADSASQTVRQQIDGVLKAEQSVLPLPAELQPSQPRLQASQ